MNKYKEALNNIKEIVIDEHADGYYQPRTVEHFYYEAIDDLNELVEKSTPKKPKPSGYKPSKLDKWLFGSQKTYVCPTCGNQCLVRTAPNGRNENKYCYDCGQALDWGG